MRLGRTPSVAVGVGLFCAGVIPAAGGTAPWVEVRSPNFVVASDAGAKEARRVAWQFEQIRGVFERLWPWARLTPAKPILILAVRDESSLKALLPGYWERKGGIRPAGLFVSGLERHYVVLRTDVQVAEGDTDNPYRVPYHEYVHLLLDLNFDDLPPWFNEGMAEFYGNTIVRDQAILQGPLIVPHLRLLRERTLLPLKTLFAVDRSSPHYNEEEKASIFYAESWALMHYLMLGDGASHAPLLNRLAQSLKDGVPALEAQRQALGDPDQLEKGLQNYVRRAAYPYRRWNVALGIRREDLPVRPLPPAESGALRATFLVETGRPAEARALAEQAKELDPKLAAAPLALGLLALREKRADEARRWIAEAVRLDSNSYLAHYLDATLGMHGQQTPEELAREEASLRRAIEANKDFAPAYALLAEVSAYRSRDYQSALPLVRRAVALEPGVTSHRLALGRILSGLGKVDDARVEGEHALEAARSESGRQAARRFLDSLSTSTSAPARGSAVAEAPPPGPDSKPAGGQPADGRSGLEPPLGLRLADGAAGRDAAFATAKGMLVAMSCLRSGGLLFVIETGSRRLTLHTDAPDHVFLRKGGAWVQMDWKCGPQHTPVAVRYVPGEQVQGGVPIDGTAISFDLDVR